LVTVVFQGYTQHLLSATFPKSSCSLSGKYKIFPAFFKNIPPLPSFQLFGCIHCQFIKRALNFGNMFFAHVGINCRGIQTAMSQKFFYSQQV